MTYLRTKSLVMDSSSLQLPTTLVNAIQGFDFDGQPLWRISQQRSHVKIEITYSLNDADQPTNQPGRAVRDSSKRRRRRPRPRRPQPTRTSPRTIEPPTPHTVERLPPATIQRPASSTSVAEIPPSPTTYHNQLSTVPPSLNQSRVPDA